MKISTKKATASHDEVALKITSLTMKTKLQSEFDVPFTNNPHDACSKNDKEDGGAMLVEWWNISLRGMLYDLHNGIGMDDGVVNELRSPSVAELKACEINSITFLHLTDVDAITDDYSVG